MSSTEEKEQSSPNSAEAETHKDSNLQSKKAKTKMEENSSINSTELLVKPAENSDQRDDDKQKNKDESEIKDDDAAKDKDEGETQGAVISGEMKDDKIKCPIAVEESVDIVEDGDVVDGKTDDKDKIEEDEEKVIRRTNGSTKDQSDGIIRLTVTEGEDSVKPVNAEDIKRFKEKRLKQNSGLDEIDAVSIWSYVMVKDFRYYFQHPYCRLFIAYFVTFCNFMIYAEDPVAHSMKECTIPMIGNDFAFVCTRYAPNAWSLLKVILWLAGILVGIIVGKLVVHTLLFNRLFRLRMFENDMGSWMTMFLTTLIVLFIFSLIYNLFLMIGGDSTTDYSISSLMGLTNSLFMKMAATGTWCGDFFTAWMVTDMMLQEKLYPQWGVSVRRWWNTKYNRIILFWVVTTVTSFIVLFVIATDYIQWDKLNRDFLHSNEVSRAFLASFILVMDILIVVQDWDFPHFASPIDIKLPGLNTANIKFDIPKCLKREVWQVHITGKWFNYGILFLVMILDLNMWKNQIFYAPYDYGQYVDSNGKIHSVQDDYSLENFNETLLSYSYRSVTINPSTNQTYIQDDTVMNTRYWGYHLAFKLLAFIPSVAAFITFGVLVWKFGRRAPSDEDVYAGRLMKRKKGERRTRFSFKNLRSKINLRRKVQAVPKLLAFTRRTRSPKTGYPENYNPEVE